MYQLQIKTCARTEMVDITQEIRSIVKKSGVKSGLCVIFVPHTTAGVTINENADPHVIRDIIMEMGKIIPFDEDYSHSEGNSDAHIKSTLFGPSVPVIIENGDLVLGRWQGIYFCEFDGPRNRKCYVKIID